MNKIRLKKIKFDLPINGIKVRTIDELRDNFTTEILEYHRTGVLLNWLKSRDIVSDDDNRLADIKTNNDAERLMALCKLFRIEIDPQVAEIAVAQARANQGVTLADAYQEQKYKEKFEQLSALLDGLKEKKLYLSQDEYDHFVKNKVAIDRDGMVKGVIFCDKVYNRTTGAYGRDFNAIKDEKGKFVPIVSMGDVVEVGNDLGNVCLNGSSKPAGVIKSPVRGVVVELAELLSEDSIFKEGATICFIREDHDIDPTMKIVTHSAGFSAVLEEVDSIIKSFK